MGTLLTFLAVGLVTLIAAGIVLSIVGAVFGLVTGLAWFLLTKVAPVMLLGWITLKIIDRFRTRKRLSSADRRWLEDG
jgi:cell division protein FtsW (lipid II flippase)